MAPTASVAKRNVDELFRRAALVVRGMLFVNGQAANLTSEVAMEVGRILANTNRLTVSLLFAVCSVIVRGRR